MHQLKVPSTSTSTSTSTGKVLMFEQISRVGILLYGFNDQLQLQLPAVTRTAWVWQTKRHRTVLINALIIWLINDHRRFSGRLITHVG